MKERRGLSPPEVVKFVNSLRTLLSNIERLPMPVICAIDGVALGGNFVIKTDLFIFSIIN